MWWCKSSCTFLSVGKLSRASLSAENGAPEIVPALNNNDIHSSENDTSKIDSKLKINSVGKRGRLLWIDTVINGEKMPTMLDSGATHNCLALRCVLASKYLKKLTFTV